MVELGNFELDEAKHTVKIKGSDIYIVSIEKFGSHTTQAFNLFKNAYRYGRKSKEQQVKEVLGIK